MMLIADIERQAADAYRRAAAYREIAVRMDAGPLRDEVLSAARYHEAYAERLDALVDDIRDRLAS